MFHRHYFAIPAGVRAGVLGLLLSFSLAAHSQSQGQSQGQNQSQHEQCERDFKPSTGQPGKDVVWVPTNDALVTRMLEMATVKATDLVYDLGAGDGKIAIAAAKQFGATAVGVEYNPEMAKLAQCFVQADGVADKVKIVQGDIFETDFTKATVVTLYLLPELNLRLRPTLLKMPPGTRVVSHSFLMDDWQPDESSVSDAGAAYLWIVPAQVAGSWKFKQQGGKDSFDLKLDQVFQRLTGTIGAAKDELMHGELEGSQISLTFSEGDIHTRLKGRVTGDRIVAQVTRNNKTSDFVGTRQ